MPMQEKIKIILKIIGNCELIGNIGESKLGFSYIVQHKNLGHCVLKIFKDDVITRKFYKSLKKHIDLLSNVSHPSISNIYKISEDPYPYMFREYINGKSLDEKIAKGITPSEATLWVEKTALALQAAYNFDIYHRNLKPSNIFIYEDDVFLTDFSLPASLSYYLSPEHCNKKQYTHQSDMYSLGIIYYHTLTGNVPFQGKFRAVKKQHLEASYPKISGIPHEIECILDKTLAKNPKDRYETMFELIDDLRIVKKIFTNNTIVEKKVTFAMPQIFEPEEEQDLVTAIDEYHHENDDTPVADVDHFNENEAGDIASFFSKPQLVSTLQDFSNMELDKSEEFIPGQKPDAKNLPEVITKALIWITDTRDIRENGKILKSLTLNFNKSLWDFIGNYLEKVLRRECWLIEKTSNDEILQMVIDLSQAKTFRYYHYFHDQIKKGLQELPRYSTIHKTFFTQVIDSKQKSESSQSRASLFSLLDSIMSLDEVKQVEDEVKQVEDKVKQVEDGVENEVENTDPITEKSHKKESQENDNWLKVEDAIGESICQNTKDIEDIEEDGNNAFKETVEIIVHFNNQYQTAAWLKIIRENSLQQGVHFKLNKEASEKSKRHFIINLLALQEYQKQQEGISNVKDFFQSDYHIERLDHGGMATVLKLITKSELTIIFLRPENYWARDYFGKHLRIRKTKDGKEGVYAEMPKGYPVVVKVAFEGREEALIYESRLLSKLAEEKNIRKHIICMIQQGSFLASSEESVDQERVGYYMMMEYASQGNIEEYSKRFPHGKLSASVAFNVLYSMIVTLQFLKKKGIIHRDIKPQNILMSEKMVPKLGDFGLAITVDEAGSILNEERRRLLKLVDKEFLHISTEKEQCLSKLKKLQDSLKTLSYPQDNEVFEKTSKQIVLLKNQRKKLILQELERADNLKKRYRPMSADEIAVKGEFAGSMIYAAPEQFSPSKVLTCSCDVYQLAAVTYTMLTGKPPVYGKNISSIMSQIILNHKPRVSDEIKDVPIIDMISDLLYDMMNNDPQNRVSVDDACFQLEKILLDHFADLQLLPYYQAPKNMSDKDIEVWQQKVKFAHEAHDLSLKYIEEWRHEIEKKKTFLKNKNEIEKEKIYTIEVWWEESKMPRHFRFRCPKCVKNLKLPSTIIGKNIRCPHCQSKLIAKIFQH